MSLFQKTTMVAPPDNHHKMTSTMFLVVYGGSHTRISRNLEGHKPPRPLTGPSWRVVLCGHKVRWVTLATAHKTGFAVRTHCDIKKLNFPNDFGKIWRQAWAA